MSRANELPRVRSRRRLLALSIGLGLIASLTPASIAGASPAARAEGSSLAPFDAVDQFIGTQLDTTQNKSNDAYGNTYPGATVPFGMVQPSPTTYKVGETNDLVREKGGYEYTANQIRGFGMTRYSGTGCHTRFGGYEFPTMPFAGALASDGTLPRNPAVDGQHRSYFTDFSHDDEVAQPGYYKVTTADGVGTELTATRRTAVSRFDFSQAAGSTLILDASGANNRTFEVELEIDEATRTVSGSMYGTDVCDNGNFYRAYFSTTYDQAFASFGTWKNDAMTAGSATTSVAGDTGSDQRHKTGGWVTFADDAVVTAKTGFSYTSVEAAAANAAAETTDKSFDQVRASAKSTWEEALGTVDVTGGTDDERTKLYTALYHSLLQPTIGQDADGRYLGFDNKVDEVESGHDFFRRINFAGQGWDMYRSQAQLIAMLFPKVANDINRSIVTLTQQTGKWSPGAARMSGDNYQVVLSTLDAFGATDYDRQAALDSMKATQLLPVANSTRSEAFQYSAAGFIENRKSDSATSRVLEYAVDDFSIAQLAERLGDETTYDTFMTRAQNWQNVFDPKTQHIRPRERTGFDRGFDLRNRDQATNGGQFNQSTGYQYGWMVPHNIGELVDRRGGKAASTRALDTLMERLDAGAYTQTGNYLSNEAAFTTPWVYNWLQAPHKATDVLHRAVTEMYNTTPKGLPGNDDEGALSAWYVFANLGVAPMIHGTANLLVTAPLFDQVKLSSLGSDRVYTINAPGVSDGKRYTTGLEVDGVAQTRSWVGEDFARKGGTLDFTMAATPGTWGTGADDVPPSYGAGIDDRNNIGTSPNGATKMGSMDLSDWSFSRETLAASGAAPGATIKHGSTGIEFTWPDTKAGQPDNWVPNGQRVDLPDEKAGSISFLGLATNGPSTGKAVVEYTDGTTQDVSVTLGDWSGTVANGNTQLVTVNGRNNANGSTGTGTFKVLGTRPAGLDVTKTVDAVVLPEADYNGVMHIFDVSTSEQVVVDPDAPTGVPDRIILTTAEDPSTSQYVTWRSASPLRLDGKVEIRTAGGETRTVDAEEKPERNVNGYPSRSHSAKLTGLKPETAYEYRVGTDTTWSSWATFTTTSSSVKPFDFLYFGDAQEGIGTVWHQTLKAAWAAAPDAKLSLYAGDMTNDSKVEQEWTDWFAGLGETARSNNALTTPGNHEVGPEASMAHYFDAFEYDGNGPVASDAGRYESTYGEHIASVLKDTVFYTDYQGVRFVNLNANRDDICPLITPPGLTSFNCDTGRAVWMAMQAEWLDRVLADNPHDWTVVQAHQPIYSTGVSGNGLRDEDNWRRNIGPVLEKHDVDLVLQGHDHTYGRGYMNRNKSAREGTSTGPIYVVANAGAKQYTLPSATDNIWTRNNGTAVVRAQDTSTFQKIRIDGDKLTFQAVVTHVRAGGEATKQVGDTLDAFTITKRDNGAKWVTESGVEAPAADVPSEAVPKASTKAFDPKTFGDAIWDDDFTTDKLAQYTTRAGNEPEAALSVDTEAGVLKATATGDRRWTNLNPPVEGAEKWAMIIEPKSMANTGAGEDSLFLGASADNKNMLANWFNNSRDSTGYDFALNGSNRDTGRGNTDLSVDPGDRLAFVHEHGQVSSWIEEKGTWRRYNVGLTPYVVDDKTFSSWKPTLGLRLDPGTISIDRITMLDGDVNPPVTPDAVTFDDQPGTDTDTYTVPAVEGVEYVVGDQVVAAGSHPGAGTVTVMARASGPAPIADGAVTEWSHVFSTQGDEDPEAVTMGLKAAGRTFGTAVPVSGTLTGASGRAVSGTVAVSVDGRAYRTVAAVNGRFSLTLSSTLKGGLHSIRASYAGGTSTTAASRTVAVRVAKARPKVTLKVSPTKVKAKRTRVTAVVTVRLPGSQIKLNGRVKIKVGGKTVTANVRNGKARVKLGTMRKTGRLKVTASYSPTVAYRSSIRPGSAKSVRIRVTR